ncbi:fe(2+) transport protein 1-like [Trifolium pratense]|uniref:Uncharacterized protein n=3 Tax=Trifolium TaxID=3898 RepID=A0ACB0K2H4_TRIPR|nr:fe(2+) transport protein 1-like [Trifolium pratense]CAJ2650338.1 unnamed protein product [Trifolium pratense]
MANSVTMHKLISIIFILITLFTSKALADCESESSNSCNNKEKALPLKIISIFAILVTSMIGVSLPLVSRSIPSLSPERDLFVIVKCFAAGIILGTGFMHVLPDSYDMLRSDCLEEKPWHEFPFSGLVAMFSAVITMMVDSLATSYYSGKSKGGVIIPHGGDQEMGDVNVGHSHGGHHHMHGEIKIEESAASQLLRYRVVAMVLELGIVVHSVVIGLSMGASNNTCSLKGLAAALCFHQMFEGMGLGGCILQAEYKFVKKAIMVFFFSVTTPLGIALGIAMSSSYKENSPKALITVGLLNGSSAGLLIYMALVDLLAADFMSKRMQGSIKLQLKSYIAVFIGAGGMSLMAKWA